LTVVLQDETAAHAREIDDRAADFEGRGWGWGACIIAGDESKRADRQKSDGEEFHGGFHDEDLLPFDLFYLVIRSEG
jgi:hypothetical protein